MSPLRHVPPAIQHWVVPYVLIVLTVLAIAAPVAYFTETTHTTAALHRSDIHSCHRSNVVRSTARRAISALTDVQVDVLRDAVAQNQAIPPRFFPSIPPAQFHRLVREQNAQRLADVRKLDRLEAEVQRTFRVRPCPA
jgi:hypothetical protein